MRKSGRRKDYRSMTLDQVQPGSECRIKKLSSGDELCRRLLTMGVYPGLSVRVVRNAPLLDPMEVEIQRRFVSLRRKEARFIEVNPA
jgi:ferrous iron transport protein A